MIEHVWLIPLIMLSAALINGLLGRKLGVLTGHIAWISMASCAVISFLIFGEVWAAAHHDHHWPGVEVSLWSWFNIPNAFGPDRHFVLDLAFKVDQLTSLFLCFVSFIGTLVFIYATGYMKEYHDGHLEADPGYPRFFTYVCLFAASMFVLVLADNLAVMFIGWEGVGLCSYLLIGYFYEKQFSETLSCSDAGRKAFVMNRIGDAGLVVGMGILFWGLGTLKFSEINTILTTKTLLNGEPLSAGFFYGGALITAASLAMFLGATGKSAQIPLFTWLPDAMAGPTPVSALIHAATMVTAGVYMIARLNVVYFLSPTTMATIATIGALTAFFAATMALTQRGIKKVLAYSTVSQLGYMFLGLGVGTMAGGIFHVFTHAFFKGCLFLCAGSVIHAMHHEEDMMKMGGLKKYMPITWICYFVATLAIAGIFPFAGFFSKDEILYHAYLYAGSGFPILWLLGCITALLTAYYMGRSLFLTFHGGTERIDHHTAEHLHESPLNMTAPLIILAVCSLVVGFLNVPKAFTLIPVSKAEFHHFLAPVVDAGAEFVAKEQLKTKWDYEAGEEIYGSLVLAQANGLADSAIATKENKTLEVNLAIVSSVIALLGLSFSLLLFGRGVKNPEKLPSGLGAISYYCWGWDWFYSKVFKDGTMSLSRSVWLVDKGFIDGMVNGVAEFCRELGESARQLQTGRVQAYGLVMVIGVCVFVAYFALGLSTFLGESYQREEPRETTSVLIQSPAPNSGASRSAAPVVVATTEGSF
ncbi:MAG: NADH-quinone oxidoreductase subunit L [Candidatus Sumerlaeia bacterium]|nr:NADH-quinone oxidoreductase subunit L [Candidatus Sumerlaeia bacterium]